MSIKNGSPVFLLKGERERVVSCYGDGTLRAGPWYLNMNMTKFALANFGRLLHRVLILALVEISGNVWAFDPLVPGKQDSSYQGEGYNAETVEAKQRVKQAWFEKIERLYNEGAVNLGEKQIKSIDADYIDKNR